VERNQDTLGENSRILDSVLRSGDRSWFPRKPRKVGLSTSERQKTLTDEMGKGGSRSGPSYLVVVKRKADVHFEKKLWELLRNGGRSLGQYLEDRMLELLTFVD